MVANLPQFCSLNCQPIYTAKYVTKSSNQQVLCLRHRNSQYYEKPSFSKKQKYFEILKWTKINVQK